MALRILTQINFSAGANPDGDSGLRFTARLLKELHRCDRNIHFYVLVPEVLIEACEPHLPKSRLTLIPLNLPPRLHGGDFAFNPIELYERFDFRRYDVDVLFLNQPETAPAFLNFFNRQTYHLVPAVTYIHWFDTRRPSTPKDQTHRPAILSALAGLHASTVVGCNSRYGQSKILAQARGWFNEEVVAELDAKIRVIPPSVSVNDVMRATRTRNAGKIKKILINHRVLKYTGVRQLLDVTLPRLWEAREDFRVVVTNPSGVRLPTSITDAPWIEYETLEPDDYYAALWGADIVLAPHRATHWSISTLEAVCAGCLPICNSESFFPEMFEPLVSKLPERAREQFDRHCMFYRATLIQKLHDALDHLSELSELRSALSKHARSEYRWSTWTGTWLDMFKDAYQTVPSMSLSNPSMVRILDTLRREGPITKEALLRKMKWAPKRRTIAWTTFRKALGPYVTEDAGTSDVVFHPDIRKIDVLLRRQNGTAIKALAGRTRVKV